MILDTKSLADSQLLFLKGEDKGLACLVVRRAADRHELSLSTCRKSLVEFDAEGKEVEDHGDFVSLSVYLERLALFLAVERA